MNLLVGSRSQEYKDWDGDDQITDPGDGYGLGLPGDNLGYIQAVYSHADYAANSPSASQNIIINGERVKVCTQNMAQWVPQLRERVLTVLNSTSLSDMDTPVRDSVALANQLLNGLDQDDNGKIDPAPGEGGMRTAYEYSYYMADMPLLPANPLDASTATATPSPVGTGSTLIRLTNTVTRAPNTQNTPVPTTNNPTAGPNNPQPTQKPKKPTHTPKPPNPPGGPQPTKKK
jgi:hypothetical protein